MLRVAIPDLRLDFLPIDIVAGAPERDEVGEQFPPFGVWQVCGVGFELLETHTRGN